MDTPRDRHLGSVRWLLRTLAALEPVDPTGKLLGNSSETLYRASGGALVPMHPDIIESSGGSGDSHANIQPFLCINFIIALFGTFPSG